jgi:hypothetical protein
VIVFEIEHEVYLMAGIFLTPSEITETMLHYPDWMNYSKSSVLFFSKKQIRRGYVVKIDHKYKKSGSINLI